MPSGTATHAGPQWPTPRLINAAGRPPPRQTYIGNKTPPQRFSLGAEHRPRHAQPPHAARAARNSHTPYAPPPAENQPPQRPPEQGPAHRLGSTRAITRWCVASAPTAAAHRPTPADPAPEPAHWTHGTAPAHRSKRKTA